MITFLEYLEEAEVKTSAEARRKYPNSLFPEKTAENRRAAAKIRLAKMKNKSSDNSSNSESNIGSPVGSPSDNNY